MVCGLWGHGPQVGNHCYRQKCDFKVSKIAVKFHEQALHFGEKEFTTQYFIVKQHIYSKKQKTHFKGAVCKMLNFIPGLSITGALGW